MPTYTSRNLYKQILTGEETDTWGVDENTTKQRMDDATDGVLAISVNGSYSLVYANDATDQNHYAAYVVTGNGGTVHMQAVQGVYFVINRANSAVTFTSGGAANAVLQTGDATWIVNDGNSTVSQETANGSSLRAYIDQGYASLVSLVQNTSFAAAAGNLPAQSGQGGNYLSTSGTVAGWAPIGVANVVGLQAQLTGISSSFSGQLSAYQSNVTTELGAITSGGALTGTSLANPSITNATVSGSTINSSTLNGCTLVNPTMTGAVSLPYGPIFAASGQAGGRAVLNTGSSSSLSGGSINVDTDANVFRVFESGGYLRGAYIDLTTCGAYATTQIWHSGNFTPSNYQPVGNYQAALGYTPLNKAGDTLTGTLNANAVVNLNDGAAIAPQQTVQFNDDTDGSYYYQQVYQGNFHIWKQGGTDLFSVNTTEAKVFGNDIARVALGGQQNSGRITVGTGSAPTLAVGEIYIQVQSL